MLNTFGDGLSSRYERYFLCFAACFIICHIKGFIIPLRYGPGLLAPPAHLLTWPKHEVMPNGYQRVQDEELEYNGHDPWIKPYPGHFPTERCWKGYQVEEYSAHNGHNDTISHKEPHPLFLFILYNSCFKLPKRDHIEYLGVGHLEEGGDDEHEDHGSKRCQEGYPQLLESECTSFRTLHVNK